MAAEHQSTTDPDATRLLLRAERPSWLPVGTRLRDFEVQGVVGEGGFSIVYAAVDINLRRRIALKEYMPTSLARRCDDRTVQPRSVRDSENFDLGRRSFINEARLLAQFDHPALVKVHQFWEENGTAYMAMPLYEGRTIKQWLKERAQPPTEVELKRVFAPLLDALERLHAESVFHRDVAPDNILLLDDGKPVLLDFGAARKVLADSNNALTAILKPSYAPIEQYADMAQLRQGPWTDGYALCAVLYFAITGAAPPPAVARSISDRMVPAAEAGAGRYSPHFLRAIDAGLAVRPEARPQSIAQLRALLLPAGPLTAHETDAAAQTGKAVSRVGGGRRRSWQALATGAVAVASAAGFGIWVAGSGPPGNRDIIPDRQDGQGRGQAAPAVLVPTLPSAAGAPGKVKEDPALPADPAKQPDSEATTRATASQHQLQEKSPRTVPMVAQHRDPERTEGAADGRGQMEPARRVAPRTSAAAVTRDPSARERCLQILKRMQLGELPSAEAKSHLQKECS